MPLPGAYSSGTLPKTPRWRTADGAGGSSTRHYPEAASQTFQHGELVGLNSSGQVINLGTIVDPGAGLESASLVAGDLVLGMALASANNTTASTTNNIPVILATDNVEFFLRLYNDTATDAQLQDVAVGDKAELFRYNGAGDIQTVCSAAPSGTDGINKVVITEKPDDRSATDQYPGVWVKVRSALQTLGGL